MAKRSTKTSKARIPEDVRIAKLLLPKGQARPGLWIAVDAQHFTDADTKDAASLQRNRTIRRKSRFAALDLHPHQAAACQWYADAHALRYDTQGITARYGEVLKSGKTSFDHMPKTAEQEDALANLTYARAGISPSLLPLFEAVVLRGCEIGNRRFGFVVAVEQLVERIGGRL